jgi:hypothetical protein
MNATAVTLPTDRLVEYVCIAGAPEDALLPSRGPHRRRRRDTPGPRGQPLPLRTEFAPVVLDRLPRTDHTDSPFPGGLAAFCLPYGVRLRRPVPPAEPLPSFFTFVVTGAKGGELPVVLQADDVYVAVVWVSIGRAARQWGC